MVSGSGLTSHVDAVLALIQNQVVHYGQDVGVEAPVVVFLP